MMISLANENVQTEYCNKANERQLNSREIFHHAFNESFMCYKYKRLKPLSRYAEATLVNAEFYQQRNSFRIQPGFLATSRFQILPNRQRYGKLQLTSFALLHTWPVRQRVTIRRNDDDARQKTSLLLCCWLLCCCCWVRLVRLAAEMKLHFITNHFVEINLMNTKQRKTQNSPKKTKNHKNTKTNPPALCGSQPLLLTKISNSLTSSGVWRSIELRNSGSYSAVYLAMFPFFLMKRTSS